MGEARSFVEEDQQSFAKLSGDYNPLHLDPIAARRTLMGAPVVHGIHLVLWALESVLRAATKEVRLTALTAAFRKPVLLNQPVSLEIRDSLVEIRSEQGSMVELRFQLGDLGDGVSVSSPNWSNEATPADLSFAQAASASGREPLAVDPSLATRMFPAVVRRCGVALVAELLALTRIVGMRCPGRQSLFAGFALSEHLEQTNEIAFQAIEANEKYSLIRVRVTGPTLSGKLDTFFRRAPAPLRISDAVAAVSPNEFASQRALVIGGTRGLGEAFTKALCAGGAQVCFTYVRGEHDARQIEREVREAGFVASAIPFDVRSQRTIEGWPFDGPPTHLYYLATPTLHSIRKNAPFRHEEVHELVEYFVTGLDSAVRAALAGDAKGLVVWSPSTTMLSTMQGGLAYCIAKAAMEELGRQLGQLYPVTVHMPRLARVDTDQTVGLVALPTVPALGVALEHLRRL